VRAGPKPADASRQVEPDGQDGVVVGDFKADMLVVSRVILELKASQAIVPTNEVQDFRL
jgi:hypothetical protein